MIVILSHHGINSISICSFLFLSGLSSLRTENLLSYISHLIRDKSINTWFLLVLFVLPLLPFARSLASYKLTRVIQQISTYSHWSREYGASPGRGERRYAVSRVIYNIELIIYEGRASGSEL